ncbi:hypothetical protein NQ317_013276 [Molorchus minor]|uniref:Uncharacterized protein n=1 Tax=Molorchus minor TaxID=1323400 RepID=A0ABQ9JSV8_9CUCU|nr:hypothetical protein NQ317_013276 [Molorchus minor]
MRVLLIASVCLLVLGISEVGLLLAPESDWLVFGSICQSYPSCLTPKQEEKVRQLHKECAAETGVDEETTLKATAGELDDSNPALKQHIFYDVKVESVVTNCVKEEATPEDTAFEFAKCMMMMRKDLI